MCAQVRFYVSYLFIASACALYEINRVLFQQCSEPFIACRTSSTSISVLSKKKINFKKFINIIHIFHICSNCIFLLRIKFQKFHKHCSNNWKI